MGIARRFSLLVAVFGAVTILAQALLFREALALSLGNELSTGLIFCGWLGGVGIGGAVGGAVAARRRIGVWHVAGALVAIIVLLPAEIVLARALRGMAGFSQGEMLPFGALCWMIPLVSAPVSGLVGVAFAWLCSFAGNADNGEEKDGSSEEIAWADKGGGDVAATAPARVYMLDAAGGFAGSLLYSLILVVVFAPVALAGLMAVAMALAVAVWAPAGGAARKFAWAACALAVAFLIYGAGPADSFSRRAQWGGQRVDVSVESPYANLTAITDRGQASIFANGRLAGTAPETVGAEFMSHVPLSMIGAPRDVLIIGGGPSVAREALKHGVSRATVVEIDPVLMGLRERYLSAEGLREFHGPNVVVELTDARAFVAGGGGRYDAIIMQAGEPDTLLVNRYYTVEFFRAARRRLKPGGVFSMQVSFQENFTTPWQADLLGTHVRTLTEAFGRPLPVFGGQGVLLIARNGAAVGYNPGAAVANYLARGIRSERFGPELLGQALDRARAEQALQQSELTGADLGEYFAAPDKVGWALDRLAGRPGARVNRDFSPAGAYYQMRVSSEYYPGALKKIFARAGGAWSVAAPWLCFVALACAGAVALRLTGRAGDVAATVPAAAAAGFAGLCAEVAAVFVFQSLNGNVYYFIGAILGLFMAGGAVGGWVARGLVRRGRGRGGLLWGLGALALLCAGAGAALSPLSAGGGGARVTALVMGPVFLAGLLVGEIYPLAAAAGGGKSAGGLYAADHIGAALGAALAGVFFIPIAGAAGTMYICCATVVLCALPMVARGR